MSAAPLATLTELRPRQQWVAWRNETRGGKTTKIPYVSASRKAEADNPATWLSHDQAASVAKEIVNGSGGGVGIELGKCGDKHLIGIDLDTCRNPETGSAEPWAVEVITQFYSYTEISPSRRGFKVFGLVNPSDVPKLRTMMRPAEHGRQFKRKDGTDHPPAIELYVSNRFFTVTWESVGEDDTPTELRTIPLDVLRWLIEQAGPDFADKVKGKRKSSSTDASRSAAAFRKGAALRRKGKTFEEMVEALHADPETEEWTKEKGEANNQRELKRIWDKVDPSLTDWQKHLQLDDGIPITNLANATTALRQAPELVGIVTYDQMLQHTLITRSLPDSRIEKIVGPRPVKDCDVTAIQEWLQRHDMRRIGKETVHQAIDLVAQEHAFHPVRNYLKNLQWDGELRLGTWLNVYLGTEPCEYAKAIGTMFLIAMVARIYQPGCKCDYMPVLENQEQGTLKSTACSILAGEWFSDNLPDVTSGKDVSVHLNGKWLIEIGELSAMGKAETNAIKTFVTRQTERYRPPYGREEVIAPRQCLFIGTTNAKTYLKDETGGRRFWPIETGKIELDKLRHDRDQLFAEAVQLYQDGAQWWPSRDFELKHIRPEQDARLEDDAWAQPIAAYVERLERATVMDVAHKGLKIAQGQVSKIDQARIKAVLHQLQWRQGAKTNAGTIWLRPGVSR